MQYDLVIIGSGNVGFHLTKAFFDAGKPPIQVFNRSRRGLARIQKRFEIATTTSLRKVRRDADIYILAVKDDAIDYCAKLLSEVVDKDSIVVHTSGNVTIQTFQATFTNFGVFYPLQSFRIDRKLCYDEIPILISASNPMTDQRLKGLGKLISNRVQSIADEQRAKLHIPAVMVNNFVNFIFSRAYDYCQLHSLDFSLLFPLIKETVERLEDRQSPFEYQTGPAERGDQKTIEVHLHTLLENPALHDLYSFMTREIQNYKNENSA